MATRRGKMELKKHVVENMVDLLREMLTSVRTPYEMKTPIKMVLSEYDLMPKGSDICVAELEDRVAELEEEESQHDIAYRTILAQRDELFRENAIIRTKIGCKTCEGSCYCKPVGGYANGIPKVDQYESALETISTREVEYDRADGEAVGVAAFAAEVLKKAKEIE